MYVCGRFGEWRRAIPDNPTATLKGPLCAKQQVRECSIISRWMYALPAAAASFDDNTSARG